MRITLTLLILSVLCVETASAEPFAYVTNKGSNTVSVIDVETNMVIHTVSVFSEPEGVAVTPDGRFVYVACSGAGNLRFNTVAVIRTSDNTVVASAHYDTRGEGKGMAVSRDGKFVYVATQDDDSLAIIRTSNNKVVKTFVGEFNFVGPKGVAVGVTPQFRREFILVTNEFSSSISVIFRRPDDTFDGPSNSRLDRDSFPTGVAVAPNANIAYVADRGRVIVMIIVDDSDVARVIATVDVGRSPQGVAVTPDGRFVYVANSGDNTVSVIQTSDNTVVDTLNVEDTPTGIAVTPDGHFVYVANSGDNTVSVIQTSDNTVVDTLNVQDTPTGIAVTPEMAPGEPAGEGNRSSSDSCTLASPTSSNASLLVYLLIPAFILIARLRRRKAN